MSSRKVFGAAGALAFLQALSCGGDDGPVDPCPTGSCTLPGSTVVKWRFDEYPEWHFPGDTCIDVGASYVRVDVQSLADPNLVVSKEEQCGGNQTTFLDLAAGTWAAFVHPLDENHEPLTNVPGTGEVLAGTTGANTEVTVNVPYTAWKRAYTGTFLFRLSWGGLSCNLAGVATQTLTLKAGGSVVTRQSDYGQRMDGTDPKPCRVLPGTTAEYVELLPFGPATLLVVGTGPNNTTYTQQFDTFVGADKNNPTLSFDVVPPDAPPDAPDDAPVDAPIDAAPDAA
ncbi:MAG: hypothetical protein ACTHU0_08715 [Kofleriaceae bacterium]